MPTILQRLRARSLTRFFASQDWPLASAQRMNPIGARCAATPHHSYRGARSRLWASFQLLGGESSGVTPTLTALTDL